MIRSYINKLWDIFLEVFRKKEYFSIDYDSLNNYSIAFKEISNDDLIKIRNVILNFPEAEVLNDKKSKLFETDALSFSEIENLMIIIKDTISKDYKQTYFEALKHNWNFNYFVSNSFKIYDNVFLINNRLSYPKYMEKGTVMYSLLAIKKFKGKYYFWDLLED